VILLIAFIKFRRNLDNWQKKVQSSQKKELGNQ
jgi:hypothetical protein